MDQLKRLRLEKGLSQAKLAALADIDPSTVNQIERGAREASPATLRKLAQALDASIAELLEDAPPKALAPPSLFNSLEERRGGEVTSWGEAGEGLALAGIGPPELYSTLQQVERGELSAEDAFRALVGHARQ